MDARRKPPSPPPRRVALVLILTGVLLAAGLGAVVLGDQAFLHYVEAR
jgi:hypothetical protein